MKLIVCGVDEESVRLLEADADTYDRRLPNVLDFEDAEPPEGDEIAVEWWRLETPQGSFDLRMCDSLSKDVVVVSSRQGLLVAFQLAVYTFEAGTGRCRSYRLGAPMGEAVCDIERGVCVLICEYEVHVFSIETLERIQYAALNDVVLAHRLTPERLEVDLFTGERCTVTW
jgi:hypothetical protein